MPLEQELKQPEAPESLVSGTTPAVVTPTSEAPKEDVFSEEMMLIQNTSVPFKYADRVNSPLNKVGKASQSSFFNVMNSVYQAAIVTKDTFNNVDPRFGFKQSVNTGADYSDTSWEKIAKMTPDERYDYTVGELKKIEDPAMKTLLAGASAVVDTMTLASDPRMIEAYSDVSAAKQVYSTLGTALPFVRDLIIAALTGGASAIPAVFGVSSATYAYNNADNIRNVVGEDYIHPAVAWAVGFGTSYPFLRYMSAPLQQNIQNEIYGIIKSSLGVDAPVASRVTGAAIANAAENYLANRGAGNIYALAGFENENYNVQLGTWALMGAAMEGSQLNMHGARNAEVRAANRVAQKLGGKEVSQDIDVEYVSMRMDEPSFGLSVSDVGPNKRLDPRINAGDITLNKMRKLFGDESAISEEGIIKIDAALADESSFEQGVGSAFKRQFDEDKNAKMRSAVPKIIRNMKAEMAVTDGAYKPGKETISAYENMLRRLDKQDTIGDASSTEDFSQVVAHQSIRAFMNGDKPSVALESIGIDNPVILTHVDELFDSTATMWKNPTDEAFLKEARELDEALAGVYEGQGMFRTWKGKEYLRSAWTDRFEKNIQRGMRDLPPEEKRRIAEMVKSFREKWALKTGERIADALGEDTDSAIEKFGVASEIGNIMRQSNNAEIAANIHRRYNYYFKDTGYQLPKFTDMFGGKDYDGLLTDNELSNYIKQTNKIQSMVRNEGIDYASKEIDPDSFVGNIYKNFIGGATAHADNMYTKSLGDPILKKMTEDWYWALKTAGNNESVLQSQATNGQRQQRDLAKSLFKTDWDVAMRRANVVLDDMYDTLKPILNDGGSIETVEIANSQGRIFKAPKQMIGRYSPDELFFAQKVGNQNANMFVVLNKADKSLVPMIVSGLGKRVFNFNAVDPNYREDGMYFPRAGNEKFADFLRKEEPYEELLQSDRPYMNHGLSRKPGSMLSRLQSGNDYRYPSEQEHFEYVNNWIYSMTKGQAEKILDRAFTHIAGIAEVSRTKDGHAVYGPRRFMSKKNGISSIPEKDMRHPVLQDMLDYYKSTQESTIGRTTSRIYETEEKTGKLNTGFRAMRSVGDVLWLPADLIGKTAIGLTAGPVYATWSALQAQQVSMPFMLKEYSRNPLRAAKEIGRSMVKMVPGFMGLRTKLAFDNTIHRFPRLANMAKAIYDPDATPATLQKGIAEIGYRKGQPSYNKAWMRYMTDRAPELASVNSYEPFGGVPFGKRDDGWSNFKKTKSASDFVRFITNEAGKLTDFLVWNVPAADAASKSFGFALGWDHFDDMIGVEKKGRIDYRADTPEKAKLKKDKIWRELHGSLFSPIEWSKFESYLKTGNRVAARELYATMLSDRLTPAFTLANRSQIAKTMSEAGKAGLLTAKFTEWAFKNAPNAVQAINELKYGNWVPVAAYSLMALAAYDIWDEWKAYQGEIDKSDRNDVGKDVINIAMMRNFQDATGMAIHASHFINNNLINPEGKNQMQKMSMPQIPFLGQSFLTGTYSLMADIASVEMGEDADELAKQNKWDRIKGYKAFVQLFQEGNYTETKIEEAEDFLDFIIDYGQNKYDLIRDLTKTPTKPTTAKEETMNDSRERRKAILDGLKAIRNNIKNNKPKEK